MKVTPARRAALETLRAARAGELADRALDRALEEVPPRNRPWTQELVYGTFRFRGRLDHRLGALVRRGLDSLEPDVLDILRLGAYQLLEMDSVPAYAAVSQAVEMAKSASGRGAGGLVNGVLQTLRREGGSTGFPSFEDDPVAFLSTWGSHPEWLVERWVARFGAEGARSLVEANNERPELYIRPIGMSVESAREELAKNDVPAEPVPFAPDALRVRPPATAHDVLGQIPAIVQDPAAGLVVRYADWPRGAVVADLCAAPGGKALASTDRAGYVVAADQSFRRIERVRSNVERIREDGAMRGGIGLVVADARKPPIREVDAVLLDVPCTGTGTLRRHPDGKWRLRPSDLESLVALQRDILDAAATRVRPGGLLVYATCSLEPEENEEQVDAFLRRNPDFEWAAPPSGTVEDRMLDAAGRLVVLPQDHGVDGAFAARLRRKD